MSQDARQPLLSVDADVYDATRDSAAEDPIRMRTMADNDEKSQVAGSEAGSSVLATTINIGHVDDDNKHGEEQVLPIKQIPFEEMVSMWREKGDYLDKGKLPDKIPNVVRFKHMVHLGGNPDLNNLPADPKKKKDDKPKKKEDKPSMLEEVTDHLGLGDASSPMEREVSMPKTLEDEVREKVQKLKIKKYGSATLVDSATKKIAKKAHEIAPKYQKWLDQSKHMVFQMENKRRILFFDGKIKRLSNINTAEESFEAVYHFYLTYLATEAEARDFQLKKLLGKEGQFNPKWDPVEKLLFTNRIDGDDPEQAADWQMKPGYEYMAPPKLMKDKDGNKINPFTYKEGINRHGAKGKKKGPCSFDISKESLGFDPRYGYWLRMKYECQMTFAEEFELFAFPFDTQDLTIEIGCEPGVNELDILPFPRLGDFALLDPRFSLISEWQLESILVETGVSPIPSKMGKKRNRISVHIKASRRWMASLSYWIVTFCMFGLSLATFAMAPVDDLGDRLGFGITFLLADVATLQLLEEKTPAIPYWTLLDYYMYSCFVFLSAIICWSGLVGGWSRIPQEADDIALEICVAIFVLFHLFYLYLIIRVKVGELSKIKMMEKELDKKFEESGLCCGTCKTVLENPTLEARWNWQELIANEDVRTLTYVKIAGQESEMQTDDTPDDAAENDKK